MTKGESLDLLRQYEHALVTGHSSELLGLPERQLNVVCGASGMADRFPADGSEKKAMRWLGYMQGVLVALGLYTLEEVKEHSRTRRVTSGQG